VSGSRGRQDGINGPSCLPNVFRHRPPGDSKSHVLSMSPVPRAVREARRWVRETLIRWGITDLAESAVLIASELITNAIRPRNAGSSIVVLLMFAAGTLRLEVRDHNSLSLPRGRSLAIIVALSDRWGVTGTGNGKLIWSELDVASVQGIPSGDNLTGGEVSEL
jgi:hypothetical protein